LKIVRLHAGGGSLPKVISISPEWWTPTSKAKAIAGLALGLRFAHSLGFVHGHLTANNVLFNENRVIQIADFCVNSLAELDWNSGENVTIGGFSEEDWTLTADICAFAEPFSLIAVGASNGQSEGDSDIPTFVSEIIQRGLFTDSRTGESMGKIFNTLQQNEFKVMNGVNSDEVFTFVNSVESSEREME
jgi:serine/threonine protein kinase